MEHPAPPKEPEAASVWKTPLLQLLIQLPGFELLQFAQGLWGAKSPKPTSLLVLNIPGTQNALRQWQVTSELPQASSIGLNSFGQWATTALKEYPPALNGGLALGFYEALCNMPLDHESHVPQDFRSKCASMLCTTFGHHLGPDFAG